MSAWTPPSPGRISTPPVPAPNPRRRSNRQAGWRKNPPTTRWAVRGAAGPPSCTWAASSGAPCVGKRQDVLEELCLLFVAGLAEGVLISLEVQRLRLPPVEQLPKIVLSHPHPLVRLRNLYGPSQLRPLERFFAAGPSQVHPILYPDRNRCGQARLLGPCLSPATRRIYPLAGVVAEWLKAPVC
jgi:hypothetical protein